MAGHWIAFFLQNLRKFRAASYVDSIGYEIETVVDATRFLVYLG